MKLPVVEELIQEDKQQVLASPADFGLQTDRIPLESHIVQKGLIKNRLLIAIKPIIPS